MKKKILIIGILVFGIYLFFKLLGIFLFKTNDNKPIELVEFKSYENLRIQTSKPIFYYSKKKLFYSKNGDLNFEKPIFKGSVGGRFYDNDVFVSPNSKYIAFKSGKKIVIIDNKGNLVKNIGPIQNNILDNKDAFWDSEFQWSKNSENLYLMKDNENRKSSIYMLSTKTNKFKKVIDLNERGWHFYLSPNQKNVYYTAYDKVNDDWVFKKTDLKTRKTIDTIQRNDKWKLITQDSIFINFRSNVNSKELNKYIGQRKNDSLCNIYLTENELEKLVFKVNCGFDAFKDRKLGPLEQNMNIFLPNDRYFLTELYAKNHNGTIIIDTKTLEYKFYEREIKAYFSNTRTNFDNVQFTWGELIAD